MTQRNSQNVVARPSCQALRYSETPMKLAPDWCEVLKRAWSVRFIAAAFLFSVAEIALPVFGDALPISPRAFSLPSGDCMPNDILKLNEYWF